MAHDPTSPSLLGQMDFSHTTPHWLLPGQERLDVMALSVVVDGLPFSPSFQSHHSARRIIIRTHPSQPVVSTPTLEPFPATRLEPALESAVCTCLHLRRRSPRPPNWTRTCSPQIQLSSCSTCELEVRRRSLMRVGWRSLSHCFTDSLHQAAGYHRRRYLSNWSPLNLSAAPTTPSAQHCPSAP